MNQQRSAVAAILRKEILLLLRSREAVAAELYFLVGAALVLTFAFPQQFDATIQAGAIWVVFYFAAMLTVARSYVIEQERGTLRYLMHVAPGDAVYWGKLLAGVLWLVIVGLIEYAVLMLVGLVPFRLGVAVVLVAGCIAIGGATSLLAAIVAAAQLRGWVFAAIAFPVVMPVFFVGVDATATVLAGSTATAAASEVAVMLLYVTIVAIVAWWLFPFIWSEA
ncbi:MAG: cytochrome C biogenesis protein CcmB [Candidatus Kapaibacterium sp.]|nr:MAG: cytochrome C biogenesis protein CcmB [Candidatus Kapabacteria bacterium]